MQNIFYVYFMVSAAGCQVLFLHLQKFGNRKKTYGMSMTSTSIPCRMA